MAQEFIIVDNTIKYANGNNLINERLLYGGADGHWSRKFELVKRYTDVNTAIAAARPLQAILPVKIFAIEQVPNGVNVAEVIFS